jgi:hypothetical protein
VTRMAVILHEIDRQGVAALARALDGLAGGD